MKKAPHLVLSVQIQPQAAGYRAAIFPFQFFKVDCHALHLCFLDCISGFQNLRRSTAKRIYTAVLFFFARWEVVSVQVVAEDRDMPPSLYVDLLSYLSL